ncbi:MAG: hypothetical protein ABFS30_17420, partial [Pseudomonadota bacterium]
MRAVAGAARDRLQYLSCPFGAQQPADIVVVIPHVTQALSEDFARVDVAGLGQNQIQPSRIAGDQPAVLEQGLVNQSPLQHILRRLEAGARKIMDTGRPGLQIP